MSNTSSFFKTKKEWSIYKDRLLEKYLPLYLSKILSTGRDTLFIDGFAGKGKFDDGTDGSPIIIRDKIEQAHESTRYPNKVIPIFIEYNRKYASCLEQALDRDWCYVLNKDYKEEALSILSRDKNKSKNIFMYVDPFGIKHLRYNVFSELASNPNSVELLLNLNSFGFIREGCRLLGAEVDEDLGSFEENDDDTFANSVENMNAIANGTYWQDIINQKKEGVISGRKAEELFVQQYMNVLSKDFEYVFEFAVKTGDCKIPKYRMIFATRHIHGALFMCENMIKCSYQMSLDNRGQQESIFDYDYSRVSCEDDIISVLQQYGTNKPIDCKELCLKANTLNGPKYLHKDIREALQKLEIAGKIRIHRKNPLTPAGKPSKSLDFLKNDIFVELL